ncbi:MAG: FecR domain-containing protein [Verrucomicrobiales bacterium]|nr:FecR domain-containing protein [Verrucomicrobiales bacterium]
MNADQEDQLLAYLEGNLNAADEKTIAEELKGSEAMRKRLIELSIEEAALTEWAKSEQISVELENETFSDQVIPFPARRPLPWIAIAATVAVLAGSVFISQKGLRERPTTSGVARFVASSDAVWNSKAPELNTPMAAGDYVLKNGSIDLVFDGGAKVSLSGPADFSLKSHRHIHLTSGNLVARIPDEALGFIVTSPDSEVVDLGTEFGLSVSDNGNTDVHVLDGLVEVLSNTGIRESGTLIEAGEALRFKRDAVGAPSEIPVHSRSKLLGNQRAGELGVKMLRGSVVVQAGLEQHDLYKNPTGPNRIDLIPELENYILTEPLNVTINAPGNYREFAGKDRFIPAGTPVTSYLLHFRPSSLDSVFGVIRFDEPIVAILCNGDDLYQSDDLFRVPNVYYPKKENPYRGLEPSGEITGKGRDNPDWQPDEIILSQDKHTIAVRTFANTERGYDQIRILTLSEQRE